jgi:hypothetical protein
MALNEPDFMDTFNPFMPKSIAAQEPMEINYDFQGFPSVIVVQTPIFPDLKVVSDIPSRIELWAPNRMVIEYIGPPIPSTIQLIAPVESVKMTYEGPSAISLDSSNLPESIPLIMPDIKAITFDTSMIPSAIQVVGIPSVIEVIGIPDQLNIKLEMPDNPTVQMLPPVDPIPISVMITLALDGVQKLLSDQEKAKITCVALSPCPR